LPKKLLTHLTFKLISARDQTHLPCEFGANPFSGSEIFHTQTKNHRLTAPKHDLQFIACGKNTAVTTLEHLIKILKATVHAIASQMRGTIPNQINQIKYDFNISSQTATWHKMNRLKR